MNCPACGTQMTDVTSGAIKVQACKGGCGGLWFDARALGKVDQADQSAGESLLHIDQNPAIKVDTSKRRKCPRDTDIVMMRHFWSTAREIAVDECPKCEGIFLLAGELAEIRAAYKTDADRHAAAHAYYNEVFGEQSAAQRDADDATPNREKNVANLFKYVCPSYYLKGFKPWGSM
jgi:Zn-finger nucleic acid-binding protein